MPKYIYDGPVKEFDKLISEHWKGETIAPSEAKARSNLAYQYKREMRKTVHKLARGAEKTLTDLDRIVSQNLH